MNNYPYLDTTEYQQLLQQLSLDYGPINKRIVACIEQTLASALADYRQLSLIRIDLRFAHAEPLPDMPTCFQHTDPQVITRFIASLNSQLHEQAHRKGQAGIRVYPCRLRYLWVREHDGAPLPHYHLILFLNKGAHAFLGKVQGNHSTGLVRLIQTAWCRALGLPEEEYCSLVHIPHMALTHLSRDDVQARTANYWTWLQRVGYLAKQETKCIAGSQRSFGASQG